MVASKACTMAWCSEQGLKRLILRFSNVRPHSCCRSYLSFNYRLAYSFWPVVDDPPLTWRGPWLYWVVLLISGLNPVCYCKCYSQVLSCNLCRHWVQHLPLTEKGQQAGRRYCMIFIVKRCRLWIEGLIWQNILSQHAARGCRFGNDVLLAFRFLVDITSWVTFILYRLPGGYNQCGHWVCASTLPTQGVRRGS